MSQEQTTGQRCGNCRHLAVGLDKAGRRIPRADKAYTCKCPIPDLKLPDSVTKAHGWQAPRPSNWMTPQHGTECPTWEALKP